MTALVNDLSAPASERMQCMEVWGGNREVHRHFEMAGLESWIYSQPHAGSTGGGDVYYISSCASGRITRLLLADVSGHGSEASETAVRLRDLMRANINLIKQTRFVQAMNQQFADMSANQRFATAIVCSYFAPNRSLSICNAGHPQPLLYRHAENQWSPIELDEPVGRDIADTPWGVVDQATYSECEIKLQQGDLLLFYSDSLPESNSAFGRQLGCQGVHEIVGSMDARDPDTLIPNLLQQIAGLAPQNLLDDDTTVFLVRATETATTIKDNLLAPVRVLRRNVRDNTQLAD